MAKILKTLQGDTLAKAYSASALRDIARWAQASSDTLRESRHRAWNLDKNLALSKKYLSDADEFQRLAAYLNRIAEHAA